MGYFYIIIDDQSNRTRVQINIKDNFGEVATKYAEKKEINRNKVIFMLEGNKMKEEELVSESVLEAESILYALVEPE